MSARLSALKKRMLSDREVRKAYDAMSGEFELARELIAARMESGRRLPSLKTLHRYAAATGTRPLVRLVAEDDVHATSR